MTPVLERWRLDFPFWVAAPRADWQLPAVGSAEPEKVGALAWALDTGHTLAEAVRLAAVAGALATREVGARTALPTVAELTTG